MGVNSVKRGADGTPVTRQNDTQRCSVSLSKNGVRITPITRMLLVNQRKVDDDTIMGCWINSQRGKTVKYNGKDPLKLYYCGKADKSEVLGWFNDENVLMLVSQIQEMQQGEGTVPIARLALRKLLVPKLEMEPLEFVTQVMQQFDTIGVRFLAYSHYREIVMANITGKSIKEQHRVLMKYGRLMKCIGFVNLDIGVWKDMKLTIYTLIRYHELKTGSNEEFKEFVRYTLSGLYEENDSALSVFALNPMLRPWQTSLVKLSYQDHKNQLEGSKYKHILTKPPRPLNLDTTRLWKIPAACQYFELILDKSTIKCDGIVYMVLRALEKGPRKLNSLSSVTQLPKEIINDTLQKLVEEQIVIVQNRVYSIVDKFKGDQVVVIL